MTLNICCSPSLFAGCSPSVRVPLREAAAGELLSVLKDISKQIFFYSCGWFHCLYAVCSKSHNLLLM